MRAVRPPRKVHRITQFFKLPSLQELVPLLPIFKWTSEQINFAFQCADQTCSDQRV
jgi:hypothetical protein